MNEVHVYFPYPIAFIEGEFIIQGKYLDRQVPMPMPINTPDINNL